MPAYSNSQQSRVVFHCQCLRPPSCRTLRTCCRSHGVSALVACDGEAGTSGAKTKLAAWCAEGSASGVTVSIASGGEQAASQRVRAVPSSRGGCRGSGGAGGTGGEGAAVAGGGGARVGGGWGILAAQVGPVACVKVMWSSASEAALAACMAARVGWRTRTHVAMVKRTSRCSPGAWRRTRPPGATSTRKNSAGCRVVVRSRAPAVERCWWSCARGCWSIQSNQTACASARVSCAEGKA